MQKRILLTVDGEDRFIIDWNAEGEPQIRNYHAALISRDDTAHFHRSRTGEAPVLPITLKVEAMP